jgi:hypothetical protein
VRGGTLAQGRTELTLVTEVAGPLLIEVDGEVLYKDDLMHQVLEAVRRNNNRRERARGKYMRHRNRY